MWGGRACEGQTQFWRLAISTDTHLLMVAHETKHAVEEYGQQDDGGGVLDSDGHHPMVVGHRADADVQSETTKRQAGAQGAERASCSAHASAGSTGESDTVIEDPGGEAGAVMVLE
jgi:hypothetical protein